MAFAGILEQKGMPSMRKKVVQSTKPSGPARPSHERFSKEDILARFQPVDQDDSYRDTPWPNNGVFWLNVKVSQAKRLTAIVDAAPDESPIQAYLKDHPILLAQLLVGGHGRWVFPKPRFGSEHVPDFLLCEKHSGGYEWTLIELANPNFRALTMRGERTSKLTHEIQQVDDWRIWLRKNVQYAQQQLGFVDLDCDFRGIVVIGRRDSQCPKYRERYRELTQDRLTVMSYDRLLEWIRSSAVAHTKLRTR
jgi:hypothetical protein